MHSSATVPFPPSWLRPRGRAGWVLGAALAVFLANVPSPAAAPAPWPDFPLPVPRERSAAARRAAKPAVESRLLDGMEDPSRWESFGPGLMSFTRERATEGRQSARLTSPTKLDRPGPVSGRPFAETGIRRPVPGEDWSAFNRLSFRVHPHLPGFRNVSLLVRLRAAGSDRWLYTFGHLHFVLLANDQWNRVVWEIPHLPRTNVTAVELVYRLQGHEPAASGTVQFDFDDLRLERVESPDAYRGWEVAPGTLAYCHLGYEPDRRKEAVAPVSFAGAEFEIVPAAGGPPVFRGTPRTMPVAETATAPGTGTGTAGGPPADRSASRLLDFTDLRTPGRYRIRAGNLLSEPFPIGPDIWEPALVATLNQYACQRCGEPVPGIHDACHHDWRVVHGDRSLPLAGGWHDAGDLSQGLVNTAEATDALLVAAERLGLDSPAAPGWRLLAEARYGLAWMHRTRFGDGFRATWATMDFWTDGVLGNADDVTARAGDSAFENLLACLAGARAARVLADRDPAAAADSRRLAVEDWNHALARVRTVTTDLAAAGTRAGIELHRATADARFRGKAVEFGRRLLEAQETNTPSGWVVPLPGFFYAGPDRKRPHRFEHRGHNEGPAVALAELCRAFPEHPDVPAWKTALALHVAYLARTAEFAGPWRMPAAGIYAADEGDAAFQRQVRQGIRLDDRHYLRRFPVWGEMRGNTGILLSQARALSAAARVLKSEPAAALARSILEWHFGRNPFAQSLMFGVGHDFTPQYSAMSGDIVGGLPVGIQTCREEDVPYWPASNCYNYAEIWIHPSSRFLAVWADLASEFRGGAEVDTPR